MFRFLRHHTIHTYNIGFLKQTLEEVMTRGIGKGEIHWMKHRYKDRFFADPFLIRRSDTVLYVLCEEYIFWENKGKIALLEVSATDYRLLKKRTLIEEPFHLSFPNCEENGNTVIAEAGFSGACYMYTIDTDRWGVISREKIADDPLVDSVFYPNGNDRKYLFCTMLTENPKTHEGDLYIYTNQDGHFQRQSEGPILRDRRLCRSAGRFFAWNNHVFRPVQDCSVHYGWKTKILDFGTNPDFSKNYAPKETVTLDSFANPPFNETFHTFNVYPNLIVVDGSAYFQRFPFRSLFKHCPKLCQFLIGK